MPEAATAECDECHFIFEKPKMREVQTYLEELLGEYRMKKLLCEECYQKREERKPARRKEIFFGIVKGVVIALIVLFAFVVLLIIALG